MDDEDSFISFNLICPECGVGNPEGAKYCLVCDRDPAGDHPFYGG